MAQQRALVGTALGPSHIVKVPLGPRSLAEMSLKVAIDNVKLIESLGQIAPQYVDPILAAVKSAEQLHTLELNSDDIYDETEKHWKRIITKDFPLLAAKHGYAPQNPKSWHKVYGKYKQLDTEQLAAATEKMKQGFAAHSQEKQSRASTIISAERGGKLRKPKVRSGWGPSRGDQTFISATRAQLRREAKCFKLPTPSGKLPVRPGQIKKPPPGMVDEHRRMEYRNSIPEPPPVIRAPRPRPTPAATGSADDREKREARLSQIKNAGQPKAAAANNVLSFSDDEGPDNYLSGDAKLFGDADNDDLFGELEHKKPAASASSSRQGPRSMPQPATNQSLKRQRSLKATDTEQPTKRHHGVEKTPPSALLSSNKALRQPTKPLRKGLLATPGANQRFQKPSGKNVPQSAPKTVAPGAVAPRKSFPTRIGSSQLPRGYPSPEFQLYSPRS
jgi:elongin-A